LNIVRLRRCSGRGLGQYQSIVRDRITAVDYPRVGESKPTEYMFCRCHGRLYDTKQLLWCPGGHGIPHIKAKEADSHGKPGWESPSRCESVGNGRCRKTPPAALFGIEVIELTRVVEKVGHG
jgi:hypothetical protein